MERELLFVTLSANLFGAMVWSFAAGFSLLSSNQPLTSERRTWWTLAWPLFSGLLICAFLTGWVLQEPDPADEQIAYPLFMVATLTGLVVARALWRSLLSLRATHEIRLPIATVGLFRCRSRVSSEFQQAAPPRILKAALAHESVHAQGLDPLRIWLAQLICDLQWPVPGARRRLATWLLALELRCDDAAVAVGTPPVDLAEAVLLAARLTPQTMRAGGVAARMASDDDVALRVRRLLGKTCHTWVQHRPAGRGSSVLCVGFLLAAVWLGLHYGETVLGLLPGVWR